MATTPSSGSRIGWPAKRPRDDPVSEICEVNCVRAATARDAIEIAQIYAHHVLHGTGSYDYQAPDEAFWRQKISDILGRSWPFLAMDDAGKISGYAYASQMRERDGYRFTCEDSVYVAPGMGRRGVGTTLLTALVDAARAAGFQQMIAVIGGAEPASVALHAKLGFREVGRMTNVGFKFGRYLDSVYMQRQLSPSY